MASNSRQCMIHDKIYLEEKKKTGYNLLQKTKEWREE